MRFANHAKFSILALFIFTSFGGAYVVPTRSQRPMSSKTPHHALETDNHCGRGSNPTHSTAPPILLATVLNSGDLTALESDADEEAVLLQTLLSQNEEFLALDDDEEEVDVTDDFVQSLLEAPVATLTSEEIELLRELMRGLAEETYDAEVVEQLLHRLLAEYKTSGSNASSGTFETPPNSDDFLTVMKAWKRSMGEVNRRKSNAISPAVEHVMNLYEMQEKLFRRGSQVEQPNPEVVETALSVLSTCREKSIVKITADIFKDYVQRQRREPTAAMYQSMIESLARSRERGSANRAEILLKEAAGRFPPRVEDGKAVGITIEPFNVVLTAWAKSGLEYGPERAEKLLLYMEQVEAKHCNPGILRPSVSSLTSLIDAYAQTNEWEGVGQSERILNRMLDQHLEGETNDIEPNVATWTIVISAWARLSRKNNRGAAARAERLLKRMESLHKEGRISFAPDAIAYVTCMNALAFSKTDDGPSKAREILDEMYERYLDGEDTMKPSAKSIRVVIDAFASSNVPKSMEVAEEILDQYEDFLESLATPDDPYASQEHFRDIYKTMLFGWCKQGDAEQAQAYLQDMVEKDMKPDCFCWDRVIEANARAGDNAALERTLEVWRLMQECERKGDVKPNERVYTSFIRSLTRAKVEDLSSRCSDLLEDMKEGFRNGNKGLAPTVFTYNAVLLACSEDKPPNIDAFKVAIRVFNEIRKTPEGPDHVSFGNMLRCANLLPDGEQKDALIRSTFQLCCKRGSMNAFVVRDLQGSAPEPLWRSLLSCPEGEADFERLPASWSSRIVSKR